MTYELAKQLKDAGFPLKTTNFEYKEMVTEAFKINDLWYLFPTLSELIEACGDGYFCLEGRGRWIAECPHSTLRTLIQGEGSTPEEAVANLWLELNKK
jgi:hypothetical protein